MICYFLLFLYCIVMAFEDATTYLVREFDRKPDALAFLGQDPDSRFINWILAIGITASNFVYPEEFPTHGQMAQALSDWQREVSSEVSERFNWLTNDAGMGLSKLEANLNTGLIRLQMVRRGIRLAMNS